MTKTYKHIDLPETKTSFKWAFIGDLQLPWTDFRAVNLWFDVMKWWKPAAIDITGDVDDQLEYSSFSDGTTDEFFNKIKKSEDESPIPFIVNGSKDTRGFFERMRTQHKNSEIYFHQGNHECFSMESHRVVTRGGYKAWNEVSVGDEVLSVDDDGIRCWQPVEKVHLYPDDNSTLHKFDFQNVRGEFTANHRFLTKGKYGGKLREHTADKFVEQWGGVFVTAGHNDSPDADVSDESIRLLAWCLTDSSVNGNQWVFHQSEPKHERILSLLDSMGVEYQDTSRQRDTREICGKILKGAPKVSHDIYVHKNQIAWDFDAHRSLPDVAWKFSERQVMLLIEELQYTDGTTPTSGTSIPIYCSDSAKREQLRILMTMNGIGNSEREYADGYWRINSVRRSEAKVELARSDNLTKVQSEGVWCITVPNGRFFVEAFGATHLTGNCRVYKYVNKKAPQYSEQVTPELLWGTDSLGIYVTDYDSPPIERYAGIHVHHGTTVSSAGLAVKGDIENYGVSLVRGHDHRGGVVYKSYPMTGQTLVGMGTGHMCSPGEYGLRYTVNPAWELGFGIGHVDGDKAHLQFIPISKDYVCYVDGKRFQG